MAHNIGFSAMLADEYIPDRPDRLSSAVRAGRIKPGNKI
jgi:hypothetical protein